MLPAAGKKISVASTRRRLTEGLGIGALIGLLLFLLHLSGLLELLENKTWDLRVASFARPVAATGDIRLILLDQYSLDWAKKENGLGWPWPREMYAPIIKFLERAGARCVAFDVLYTEPSVYGKEDDGLLGKAIAANGRFIAAVSLNRESGDQAAWPPGLREPPLLLTGPAHAGISSARASFPIPELAGSAAMLANVLSATDPDGINRRALLVSTFDGRAVPSLGTAAFCIGSGIRQIGFESGWLTAGGTRVPLDGQGRAILRYRGPSQTHQAVNAAAVIQSQLLLEEGKKPTVDPLFFKDKYVFFGFTALGLYDLRPTPLAANYPGVEIHATLLDNLLSDDFMRRVPDAFTAAFMLGLSIIAGISIRLCRTARQSGLVFAGLALAPISAGWALYPLGLWLPVLAPESAVLLTLLAGLVINYAGEGRQKKFIKGAFSQYLSPVVIDQLVQNPERLTLGGEKRPLSILFSDVQGFTGISEKLDPVALTALLNEYLSEVTTIIYDFGGTIDKYEGDAVIAFWNAPLDLPDHAAKAVRASLRYQERLTEIRPRLREMSGGIDLRARIGINTGDVVIGNMGSAQRFNYTFFGDAGNLASRLEGMNKQFGTFFMISKNTRDAAGESQDIFYRELSRVAVVGKSEPVTVYEPMRSEERGKRGPQLEAFAHGLKLYYAGDFSQALGPFESIQQDDPPAAAYCRKLKELIEHPPAKWNGVWVATEK